MRGNGNGERLLKLPRYKQEWRIICAIMPAYLADGTNGTAIMYIDGSVEEVARRLCWVLDDLLGYLKSSKDVLRKQSCDVLGREARRVPLVLSADFCLIPVKGREIIGEHDSTVGYIVYHHVEKIHPADGGPEVYCSGNTIMQVFDRPQTLWDNIELAEQINQCMCA